MKYFYFYTCCIVLFVSLNGAFMPVFGQLSIQDVNATYIVNFDNTLAGVNNGTFTGIGFAPDPSIGQLDSDAWEILGMSDGALNFGDTQTAGDFARESSPGGETTGGLYAFDVGGSNLALGVQATGTDWSPNGTITLRIQNNSSQTLKGLRINYSIFEFNNENRATNFNFAYSSDNLVYTNVPALNYTTTQPAGLEIWLATSRSTDIQEIDISPGAFFYLRWEGSDAGGTGSRDEIALDNIEVQVTSSLAYTIGDWRPQADGVGLDDASSWEAFDGTNWIPQAISPELNSPTPSRLIIDRLGITAGNSNTVTYNGILILAGASLTIQVQDATIADDSNPIDFIAAGQVLEIQNQGRLIIEGDIALHPTAQLIVRDGAVLSLNQNSFTNQHPFWDGIENFENGSTFELNNWNWTSAPAQRSLLNATPQISNNTNGYKFGNLIFEANPTENFILADGQQGTVGNPFRLIENDFTINNTAASQALSISNATTDSYFMINGNLILTNGSLLIFNAGSTVNHSLHVTGDFTAATGTTVQLSGNINTLALINLTGDLTVSSGATFSSQNTNSELNFVGNTTQTLNIAPNINNIDFYVNNGATVQLITQNLKFNGNCSFTVETGSTFNFGFNGSTSLEIEQVGGTSNVFTSEPGSTLRISSPDGISETLDSNIKGIPPSNRNFSQDATFVYIGQGATQWTGDALGSGFTAKNVIVEVNTGTVLSIGPSNTALGISAGGRLEIQRGIFSVPNGSSISGNGDLIMTGGELQLSTSSPTVLPQLNGDYAISGGVIHLNGNSDQILQGGQNYHSLTFSNAGTKTISSALPSLSLEGTVQILGDAVLDLENNNFDGTAALIMDNQARLRIRRLNTTLPQLSGTYTLNGNSTIELYGSNNTQTQSLRGGVSYNFVEINANAANESSEEANVIASSGFSVKGIFAVNSPATFQIASTFVMSGTGSFEVRDEAGFKYGSAEGITTTGTSGNIQTTTRSYSNNADYYLIGGVEQVTGNGLPSTVRKLIVDKTANSASLSQPLQVTEELRIVQEDLNLNGNNIILDATAFLNEDRTNNHVVFDTSAADGGEGLIIANGRSYDESSLGIDISGLGLHLGHNTLGGAVIVDIRRGHKRIGISNQGIRKYFDISTVSGSANPSTIQFHYADEDFMGISELAGEENNFSLSRFGTSWTDRLGTVNVDDNFVQYDQVDAFSTWTVASSNLPLPVTLLSLDVRVVSDQEAQLIWKTAQELNNQGFSIEKSLDGKLYKTIAFVEASTEQALSKTYTFTDRQFDESAYYRLGQTDLDGKVQYSPTVFAEHLGTSALNIYPNPFTEKIHISSRTAEPVRILLMSLQGQIRWEAYGEIENLNKTLNAALPGLAAGTYIIRMETSQKSLTRKITKF
ncbi:MAG: T9SS type A sorting domain-containing protein [Microscillaceae bacterium]|nr:T9SS type A sorting domain-containing protein [Microscillaceae bacterium]